MAVVLGATPDSKTIRIQFKDYRNEKVTKVFDVDGAMITADVEAMLTALDALTNSGVTKAVVGSNTLATGWGAAANALLPFVSAVMVLTFTQVDPVNANNTITRSFTIPAYTDSLMDTDKKPVTTDSNLNALIALLEDNLAFVGSNATVYAGGFTYDRTQSGFGTVSREIDGV